MDRSTCGFPARAGADCHETWQPPGSRTRLPRAVFPGARVSRAPARSLVPGSPWRSCTYQHALPREVAATPFSTMLATRHSMRCHARTPHSQKLTQRSSAHPTPAAPDPHSPNREQGTGPALRATVAILHRTTPPATWCGTTPTPTHDCHKDTSKVMPHAPCRIVTPGHPHHAWASTTTPEHPHHAWTSTTPRHPWSSCAGRSPVPRDVARDPVQPRIATAAELSHCPRLSSWRGP